MLCNAGQWLNTELNVECNRLGFEIVSRERDELRTLVERIVREGPLAREPMDAAAAWLAAHPKELTAPEATVAGTSTPAAPPAPDPHR